LVAGTSREPEWADAPGRRVGWRWRRPVLGDGVAVKLGEKESGERVLDGATGGE
jgi:hypothetical protein